MARQVRVQRGGGDGDEPTEVLFELWVQARTGLDQPMAVVGHVQRHLADHVAQRLGAEPGPALSSVQPHILRECVPGDVLFSPSSSPDLI